ncbi:MAG TPA: class I SAM-dependent methyltransferase [Microthrixaceae bacterium]|nr:class I SAM-dependent methyltransferase [Microthrixaceae bacterium]
MSTTTAGHEPKSGLGRLVTELLGDDLPIRIELHDGSSLGPPDAPATVRVRTSDALRRIIMAPGELGFARAYVVRDIEIVGDIYAVLSLRSRIPSPRLTARQWVDAVRLVRPSDLIPMAPPPEEIRISRFGRLHSRGRDAAAISHHYDVSNGFYELVLGPSMVYSCALWEDRGVGLEAAQWAKLELICQKLALRPGIRLLDVGCGWGTLVRHAARHHGVDAVGITLSRAQAEWARDRTAAEGLSDRVEIRVQDYRDIHDGPFDAVSSVGMFEHVGAARLAEYFDDVHALMTPRGRFLNHAISRPPGHAAAISPRSFVARYVFPDGELHEVGSVVTAMQAAGFEARHVEDLREHYALTLRAWVSNLEANWDRAIAAVGIRRARIWLLYMAGSALGFEGGRIGVHQVLGLRDPTEAHFPLRPDWVASPRPAQAPAPAAEADADRASELVLGDPRQVGR